MDADNLRIDIDGRWTVRDMSSFMAALDDLYSLRQALEVVHGEIFDLPYRLEHTQRLVPRLAKLRERALLTRYLEASLRGPDDLVDLLMPDERLQVRSVQYASPGGLDLAGIGSAIGHLKDLMFKLVDLGTGWKLRIAQREGVELDNDEKRVRLAREYVALAKDIGYTEVELRQMVRWTDKRQIIVLNLAEDGKVARVRDEAGGN